MSWVFECDADSTDTSEGQYDSWASSEQTKVIRTKFREYNGSYEISLHGNNYWDGSTASGTNHETNQTNVDYNYNSIMEVS